MTIIVPALAVAFAAFGVWLMVRIVNRRERWAKWTLAGTVIGVPVLYVASFGPAWKLTYDGIIPLPVFASAYRPIGIAFNRGPAWLRDDLCRYLDLWMVDGASVWITMCVN